MQRVAFSISEFCARNGISYTTYQRMKSDGIAPVEMRWRNTVRITLEAEAAWHKARTNPTGAEAEALKKSVAELKARSRKAGRLSVQSPHHASNRNRGKRKVAS